MIYNFLGLSDFESECEINVFGNVVIATETLDNPGTSITNYAENLATAVCKDFKIPMDKLVWIEKYPERKIGCKIYPEDYSIVSFDTYRGSFVKPRWCKVSADEVDLLIEAGQINSGT